jgi:hypothetical protein
MKVMRSTPVAAAHVQADTRRHYALIRWREKSLLCPAATPSATMRCSCHAVASPESRHERKGRRIPFRPRVFEAVRWIAKGMFPAEIPSRLSREACPGTCVSSCNSVP